MKLNDKQVAALRAVARGEAIAPNATRAALNRRGLLRFTGESRNAVEITQDGRDALGEIDREAMPVEPWNMIEGGEATPVRVPLVSTDRETVIREAMAVTGESRAIVEETLAAMECVADEERIEAQAEAGGDYTHDYLPAHGQPWCVRRVRLPSGNIGACHEPVKSAIHDPQAFSIYHAELKTALDEWTGKSAKVMLSGAPTKRDGEVIPDADFLQLLTLLDHGVRITRNLYQNWKIERTAALALPIDPEKLERTIRAALDVGLVDFTNTPRSLPTDPMYVLHAAPIHLARTNDEAWCGRRITNAGHDRIRYTTRSVPGPKHQRCVRLSASAG